MFQIHRKHIRVSISVALKAQDDLLATVIEESIANSTG
jgi:hypothetical protein